MSITTDAADEGGFRALQHLVQWPKAPKPVSEFQRFPAMLRHPDHVDAVPDRNETTRTTPPGGLEIDRIEFVHTPGSPEKFPPVTVHNDAEVAAAIAKGYTPPPWDESVAKAVHNPPQAPDNYAPTAYPKYLRSHCRVVNSYAEELALMSPEDRAAVEAERAARRPTLTDHNGDVEAYSQSLIAWTLAQQAKPAGYTAAQARAAAHVSESRVTALIANGWLSEADKCSPEAITCAVAARDAAETSPRWLVHPTLASVIVADEPS